MHYVFQNIIEVQDSEGKASITLTVTEHQSHLFQQLNWHIKVWSVT